MDGIGAAWCGRDRGIVEAGSKAKAGTGNEGVRTGSEEVRTTSEGVRTGCEGVRTGSEGVRTGSKGVRADFEDWGSSFIQYKINKERMQNMTFTEPAWPGG